MVRRQHIHVRSRRWFVLSLLLNWTFDTSQRGLSMASTRASIVLDDVLLLRIELFHCTTYIYIYIYIYPTCLWPLLCSPSPNPTLRPRKHHRRPLVSAEPSSVVFGVPLGSISTGSILSMTPGLFYGHCLSKLTTEYITHLYQVHDGHIVSPFFTVN